MTEVICKGGTLSASLHSLSSFSTSSFIFDLPIAFFLFLFYQSLLLSLFNSFFLSIPQPVKLLQKKRKKETVFSLWKVAYFPLVLRIRDPPSRLSIGYRCHLALG
jgi:hypothetical protein